MRHLLDNIQYSSLWVFSKINVRYFHSHFPEAWLLKTSGVWDRFTKKPLLTEHMVCPVNTQRCHN